MSLEVSFVKNWAKIHHVPFNNSKDLITNPQLLERIQSEIDKANTNFGNWEQIKKFEITPDTWTVEAGHLTPTMKLKRKVIKEIYANLIEKIYRP